MLGVIGSNQRTCEGFSRRHLLQAGGAGLLGLNLPKLLAAESATPFQNARAKSVIFLFLFGGPSQHETFDMKPEAPDTIRGPWKPIDCRTPGLLISEKLPMTLAVSFRNLRRSKTCWPKAESLTGSGFFIALRKKSLM